MIMSLDGYVADETGNFSWAEFRRKTEDALSRLRKFPESGRTLPEFPDLPFREVIVPRYRFFYRIKGDTLWIVAAMREESPRSVQNRGATRRAAWP